MNQLAASHRFELASSFDHTNRNSEVYGSTILIPPGSPPPPFSNKDVGKVRSSVIDTEAYYLQVRFCARWRLQLLYNVSIMKCCHLVALWCTTKNSHCSGFVFGQNN